MTDRLRVRPVDDAARLAALRKLRLLDTPPEEAFDRLTRLATTLLDAPTALLTLVDDHRQFLKSATGVSPELADARETPLEYSYCRHAVASGMPLVIADARQHPLVHDSPAIAEHGSLSYAGIPVTTPDGYVVGSFCVVDRKVREWDERELRILEELAGAVVTEIELRYRASLMETFYRFKERVTHATDSDAIATALEEQLRDVLAPASVDVTLAGPDADDARADVELRLAQEDEEFGCVGIVRSEPLGTEEREAAEHLVRTASSSLARVAAHAEAVRLAEINRAVLDSVREGVVLVDPDGRIAVANERAEELAAAHGVSLGDSVAELRDASAARVSDPDTYLADLDASDAGGDDVSVAAYELDSGRSFERYSAPVRSESGAVAGRVYVLRETTAEREAERAKAELLGRVSHELRTPLASIVGFAELLAERDFDAETTRRYLRGLHGEARRLTALIDDFLDLERAEHGGHDLDLEEVDLGTVLGEQVGVFAFQSSEHALELDLGGPTTVVADRRRVAQVVANLLSNAVKYSPRGGRVRVATSVEDSCVRVSVSDDGIGIPVEKQPEIFTKFFRVDSSETRAIGGTGLGLALARELVEAQAGRIGFESQPGVGSTFWFELPRA